MAENTGKTTGSMIAAIQSAQKAVGSAITGGAAATVGADNGSLSVLEDLRSIGQENEKNTQSLLDTMKAMFVFDKEAFRRERDQARELAKEKQIAASNSSIELPTKSEATGDMGPKGLAALAALAVFAKSIGVEDVLRLPQQVKNIKGMATFAKGIGTIATFGLGPKVIDDMKAAVKATKVNPKVLQSATDIGTKGILDKLKSPFKSISDSYTKGVNTIAENFNKFKLMITENKIIATLTKTFKEAFASIKAVFMPIINTVKGLFGEGGSFMKSIDGILEPIKKLGRFIGKLFLPITLILGVIDGVQGFMKEYGETGSIVDGIRGAVVGIVDGFIGSFVRLITNLIGMALEYLGLNNLGKYIKEFGEMLTGNFSKAIGGIVDFVMGIFTLDVDRIWKGLKNVTGGVAGFFLGLITAPIDMAINFVKDIFNFGDPNKPFSLKDFFLGKDGPVMSAWNWFKGLFTFDFESLKQKLFDMGSILKGLGAGGIAAAKAILPGGESPAEAFKRVFDSYTKGNEVEAEPIGTDPIAKSTVQTVKGDVTETTYKTNTINEGAKSQTGNLNVVDQSIKTVNNTSSSKNETYVGKLDTGIDTYHDRNSWAFGA